MAIISDGPFIAFQMIGDFNAFAEKVRASITRRGVHVTGVFANEKYTKYAECIATLFKIPFITAEFVPDGQIWLAFE